MVLLSERIVLPYFSAVTCQDSVIIYNAAICKGVSPYYYIIMLLSVRTVSPYYSAVICHVMIYCHLPKLCHQVTALPYPRTMLSHYRTVSPCDNTVAPARTTLKPPYCSFIICQNYVILLQHCRTISTVRTVSSAKSVIML